MLDLSPREVVVLRALEECDDDGLQIYELSDVLSLPHSSLTYTLGQLYERNLVAYELRGRRKIWQSRLGDVAFRKRLGSLESVAGDMRIVEGTEAIKALYLSALELHPHERLTILEGNAAVHTLRVKVGHEFMREWHTLAIKREIIAESILGESGFADIRAARIHPAVVESLTRFKLWVGYVVPDAFMKIDVAVIAFREVIIIVDWASERAVVINTPEPVRLIRGFLDALVMTGRKVDLVKEVKLAADKLK